MLLVLLAQAAGAANVRDDARGFRFQVPPGYREYPEGTAPNAPYAFIRGQPEDGRTAVIRVEVLGGTIGREPLDHAIVERAAARAVEGTGVHITSFDYRTVKWRAFDLELVAMRARRGEQSVVTLSTQVPLAKQAIQLTVMGFDEEEPAADLRAILASLEGRSNWLTTTERVQRLAPAAALVAFVLVAVVVRRRRRSG
jgi:hypothetical protein